MPLCCRRYHAPRQHGTRMSRLWPVLLQQSWNKSCYWLRYRARIVIATATSAASGRIWIACMSCSPNSYPYRRDLASFRSCFVVLPAQYLMPQSYVQHSPSVRGLSASFWRVLRPRRRDSTHGADWWLCTLCTLGTKSYENGRKSRGNRFFI